MTLKQTLLADLQRQFDFDGTPDRAPTIFALLLRFFNLHFMPVVLYRLAFVMYSRRFLPLAKFFSMLNFVEGKLDGLK